MMNGQKPGQTLKFGDVIIAEIPFVDIEGEKTRPAVVLFEERGNVVVISITHTSTMQGIPLKKEEGAKRDSIIKINSIMTLDKNTIRKVVFKLSAAKKEEVWQALTNRIRNI